MKSGIQKLKMASFKM